MRSDAKSADRVRLAMNRIVHDDNVLEVADENHSGLSAIKVYVDKLVGERRHGLTFALHPDTVDSLDDATLVEVCMKALDRRKWSRRTPVGYEQAREKDC